MQKRVAVEKNLNNVKELFERNGYSVEMFDDSQLFRAPEVGRYDAIITSGGNRNFMGDHNTAARIPVITLDGQTPEEILKRVNEETEMK